MDTVAAMIISIAALNPSLPHNGQPVMQAQSTTAPTAVVASAAPSEAAVTASKLQVR